MGSRSIATKIAVAAAALAVLLGVVLALFVSQASAAASLFAKRIVPVLSERMGYEIRIGAVQARVFPRPRVDVSDVRIGGGPGEPPLLAAKRVHGFVALWPLVSSFGRDVRISSVVVEGAAVSLVTRADGSSNVAKLAGLFGAKAPRSQVFRMDVASLRSARLDWFDVRKSDNPLAAVEDLAIDFEPSGAAATLRIQGRLGSDKPNLDAMLVLAEKSRGTFSVSRLDLARLSAAFPGKMGRIVAGGEMAFRAEIASEKEGSFAVDGKGTIGGLLVGKQPASAAFGLRTTFDLRPSEPGAVDLSPLTLDRLVIGRVEARDIRTRAVMDRSTLRVTELAGAVAGGTISIVEGKLDVDAEDLRFSARGSVDKLDVPELGRSFGAKMPVSGRCSSTFDVVGSGIEWEAMRPSLAGTGRFNIEGTSVSAETTASLARPIKSALEAFALGGLFPELGAMPIEPFGAAFHVGGGNVRLDEPVALRTRLGDAVLKGTIGLDQKIALSGSVTLRWSPIPTAKAHAATFPVAVGGTVSSPVVQVTATPAQIVRAIGGAAPTISDIKNEAERRLRSWLDPKGK
jgi:hypothetical protein